MEKMKFSIFVAATKNDFGIGLGGDLPWRLSADLKRFRKLTLSTENPSAQNALIMGRKTWESIPPKFRPLKGRLNIVLSRNSEFTVPEGVILRNSFQEAMTELIHRKSTLEKCWIIGGSKVYEEALQSPQCHRIYLTEVESDVQCDTFFPKINTQIFEELPRNPDDKDVVENNITYRYKIYQRK